MIYLFLDPGESTGWMTVDSSGKKESGVLLKNKLQDVWQFLRDQLEKDKLKIIYEGFHLFPTHAQTMIGNSFFTCEVIGVIKLFAALSESAILEQMPSDKKYAGKLEQEYYDIKTDSTQHSKDAYLHYQFYKRKHKGELV